MMDMKTKKQIKSEYKSALALAKGRFVSECVEAEEIYKRELSKLYESEGKPAPKDPPKRSLLEEIGNSVTHGLGSIFAVVALILMLISANTAEEYISAVIYFAGLFCMFTMSCLYHAFAYGSAVKRLFRRFDYSGIYLLIGATFAPVLICYFNNIFGWIFFAVQWAVIAAGITFVAVFGPSRLRFLHIPLYVILGWSALALLPFMVLGGAANMATWILLGGIIYTLGIIPFTIKLKASHFIWHFFVFAGAVVQWIGIYMYIYLA
ncbi:MAG: hemolysin III family protein [Clostridia bacterium]|nr:hemolysin III family protein [Clostridia bacterium]